MPNSHLDKKIQLLLAITLCMNLAYWFSVRNVQARWANVPPAPEKEYAALYGLGDPSFAFRINGIMIQNFGDTGGRYTSLKEYNYNTLREWFMVQDYLDPHSNFIPYLAANYFGGVEDASKYEPLVDYLEYVGSRDEGQDWRWLVQAIHLARYRLKDMDRALSLANTLAVTTNPDVPAWVRQMPSFVLSAKGEKEAAYALLLEILKTDSANMHPAEIYDMKYRMCTKLQTYEQALNNPLCAGMPIKKGQGESKTEGRDEE